MSKSRIYFFTIVLFSVICVWGCSTSRYGYIESIGAKNEPIDAMIPDYFLKESMIINIDGELVHYCDQGKGPVLILLHGFTASLHTWNGWVKALKDKYRIIRLDIVGFGLTGPSKTNTYSRDQWVKFLENFAQRLDLKKFSIAGNSLGGYIAWNYAIDYPEKVEKLILIDPIGYQQEIPFLLNLACMPVIGDLNKVLLPWHIVKLCLKDVYGNKKLVTDSLVDHYFGLAMREGAKNSYVEIFRQIKRKNKDPKVSEKIKYITKPVLLMWGEEDRWVPVELISKWKNDLPHTVVKKYPGVGHIPMEEKPYLTAHDADRFLSGFYLSELDDKKNNTKEQN